MKKILEFNWPDDEALFDEYMEGLKYKWFLDSWLQQIKYEIESGKIKTASKLFERLGHDLHEAKHED